MQGCAKSAPFLKRVWKTTQWKGACTSTLLPHTVSMLPCTYPFLILTWRKWNHIWLYQTNTPSEQKPQTAKSDKMEWVDVSVPFWINCIAELFYITTLLIIADFILCAQVTGTLCHLLNLVVVDVASHTVKIRHCSVIYQRTNFLKDRHTITVTNPSTTCE